MKNYCKIITAVLLSFSMILPSIVSASEIIDTSEMQTGDIYINDIKIKNYDAKYYEAHTNSTIKKYEYAYLVPLRATAEFFGYDVSWDSSKNVVVKNDKREVPFKPNATQIQVGDDYSYFKLAPIIIDDKVYVSAEDFGNKLITNDIQVQEQNNDLYIYANVFEGKYYNPYFVTGDDLLVFNYIADSYQTLFSRKEFSDLANFVNNSQDYKTLLSEITSSENFKPAIEEALYCEEFYNLLEKFTSSTEYAKFENDVKSLDSYKNICKETGLDTLFIDSKTLEIDELIESYTKIINSKSFINLIEDIAKLDSTYDLIVATINNREFGYLYGIYKSHLRHSINYLALVSEIFYSKSVENFSNEFENSIEFLNFLKLNTILRQNSYDNEIAKGYYNIATSSEFEKIMNFIFSPENQKDYISEILNSDNLSLVVDDIFYSEEYKTFLNDLKTFKSYDSFINDIKNLESYKKLCTETGLTKINFDATNVSKKEMTNNLKKIITSKSFSQFVLDVLNLESLKPILEEAQFSENIYDELSDYSEIVFSSGNFDNLLNSGNFDDFSRKVEQSTELDEFVKFLSYYN